MTLHSLLFFLLSFSLIVTVTLSSPPSLSCEGPTVSESGVCSRTTNETTVVLWFISPPSIPLSPSGNSSSSSSSSPSFPVETNLLFGINIRHLPTNSTATLAAPPRIAEGARLWNTPGWQWFLPPPPYDNSSSPPPFSLASFDISTPGQPPCYVLVLNAPACFRLNSTCTSPGHSSTYWSFDFEFKWDSRLLSVDLGEGESERSPSLSIPIETSRTLFQVVPQPTLENKFLPVEITLSRLSSQSDMSSSEETSLVEESRFKTKPWALIRVFNKTCLVECDPEEAYAYQTIHKNGTIVISVDDWSKVNIYIQAVPLMPGQQFLLDVSIQRLPELTTFWSIAPAPLTFGLVLLVSSLVILTANRNIVDSRRSCFAEDMLDTNETSSSSSSSSPPKASDTYSRIDFSLATIGVAIFFSVPALQMIAMDLNDYGTIGDRDVCYFNEKCQYAFGPFWALNNVMSNTGYAVVGVVLLFHFFLVHHFLPRVGPNNPSVLYGIAFALVCEGICSGFYHLCPSTRNFQVDTIFMFIISGLLIAETFRKHLGEISPVRVFTFLSPLTILNYVGVLFGDSLPVLYQALCTVVFIFLHALVFLFIRRHGGNVSYYLVQVLGLLFALLLIWIPTIGTTEIALRLLSILIVSGALAQLADIARVVHSAWSLSRWRAWRFFLLWAILAVLTGICWAASLYFFLPLGVTDKSKSSWDSRDMNQGCVIGFYDSHDAWHFLSALALYFQTLLAFHFQFPTGGKAIGSKRDVDTEGGRFFPGTGERKGKPLPSVSSPSFYFNNQDADNGKDVVGIYLDD